PSVTQAAPSGPTITPWGAAPGPSASSSDLPVRGSSRPSLPPDCAVNQIVPSGAGKTSCGPAPARTGKVCIAILASAVLIDTAIAAATIMPRRTIGRLLVFRLTLSSWPGQAGQARPSTYLPRAAHRECVDTGIKSGHDKVGWRHPHLNQAIAENRQVAHVCRSRHDQVQSARMSLTVPPANSEMDIEIRPCASTEEVK